MKMNCPNTKCIITNCPHRGIHNRNDDCARKCMDILCDPVIVKGETTKKEYKQQQIRLCALTIDSLRQLIVSMETLKESLKKR